MKLHWIYKNSNIKFNKNAYLQHLNKFEFVIVSAHDKEAFR